MQERRIWCHFFLSLRGCGGASCYSLATAKVGLRPPGQKVRSSTLPASDRGAGEPISAQSHFLAGGGGGVDRIQDLLHFERFFRRDERFLSFEGATDEMVNSIFAVRHDRQ